MSKKKKRHRTGNGNVVLYLLPQGVNPAEHNYIAKQLRLIASGVLDVPAGEVAEVLVYHDDGCPLLSGGTCRCDPDFRLVRRA